MIAEIPGRKLKTHFELLIDDMKMISLPAESVCRTGATGKTSAIIGKVYSTVSSAKSDIEIMAFIQTWGEALVSAEYKEVLKALERLGLDPKKSVFYYPHYMHDNLDARCSHNDAFTSVIRKLMADAAAARASLQAVKTAVGLRLEFLYQFTA
jgi:hypothetical protein